MAPICPPPVPAPSPIIREREIARDGKNDDKKKQNNNDGLLMEPPAAAIWIKMREIDDSE